MAKKPGMTARLSWLGLLLAGWAISVSPDQGARLTEAQQLVDGAWHADPRNGTAPQVRLYRGSPIEGGDYSLGENRIRLTPTALMGREWRAILGHEVSHALLAHDGHCGPSCEIAADRQAVLVMVGSWGMTLEEAAFQVCTVLNGNASEAVNTGRVARGHDPQAEYLAFVRDQRLQSTCRPREK